MRPQKDILVTKLHANSLVQYHTPPSPGHSTFSVKENPRNVTFSEQQLITLDDA